jgi:hypothetical protein
MSLFAQRLSRLVKFAVDDFVYQRIYWKYRQFTMIPQATYVANLHLASTVAKIPGSIVECGTWRGGMIAGIADVLGECRRYYLFDSFEGLPPAKDIDGAAALAWQSNTRSAQYHDNCTASKEEAAKAMSLSAARDYQIIKGWFDDTLANLSTPRPIAILRIDADWYESTKSVLTYLASSVVRGGLIIVDDYHTWDGCTRAVNEFVTSRNWRISQFRRGGVCFIGV